MLQLEVIGNLGNDAEIKEFSGKEVCFNECCTFRKEKRMEAKNTVWVSVLWYGDGGGLFQYLKRGCKVFLRGRLVPKAYTDKQNQPQCALNMYANEVNLCGGKQESTRQDAATTSVAPNPDDDLPF